MPEKTLELTTGLTVSDCGVEFRQAIDEGRGLGSQFGGMVAKLRGGEDLGYYTPEDDSPFSALDDDQPTFSVGVAVPRFNKSHAHGTNIHMYVWDRGSHRQVKFWSHHAMLGVAHSQALLGKIREVFAHYPADLDSQTSLPNDPLPPPATASLPHEPIQPPPPGLTQSPPEPTPRHVKDTVKKLNSYFKACQDVDAKFNATLDCADQAHRARITAAQRPQHESSIQTFNNYAIQHEKKFVPLYKAFLEAQQLAREAGSELLVIAKLNDTDPDGVLAACLDPEEYSLTGTVGHILRTSYPSAPAGFIQGVQQSNESIQADIFHIGEPGFISHIVSADVSVPEERLCPWCAETIKTAAIICRFCDRELEQPPTEGSADKRPHQPPSFRKHRRLHTSRRTTLLTSVMHHEPYK